MKKLMLILLALIFTLSFATMAEEPGVEVKAIPAGTDIEINLGGSDGFATLRWNKTTPDEYSEGMTLSVATESDAKIGGTAWKQEYFYNTHVYTADIDSDGIPEIFVSGDIASCDYYTYCLHYENGEFRQLNFADAERGSDYIGYTDYGYGMITFIGDNTLILSGTQDVLGTYFGKRTFALIDGAFEIADDGLWRFGVDLNDPDTWEYRKLCPVQPVPVTFTDTNPPAEGQLQPGLCAIITASDCQTIAYFITENGRSGYFTIEPDPETGWSSLVGGIPEAELFEYIPYAD